MTSFGYKHEWVRKIASIVDWEITEPDAKSLPMHYNANKNVRMTSEFFSKCLKKVESSDNQVFPTKHDI